jgi:hypothetical protein
MNIQDAQQEIPEATPEKRERLAAMQRRRTAGERSEGLERSKRWIGEPSVE